MDRLALHKSRMESDSLRRQESEAALRHGSQVRPLSADDALRIDNSRPASTYRSFADKLKQSKLPENSPLNSPEKRIRKIAKADSDTESEASSVRRTNVRFDDKITKKKVVGHIEATNVTVSGNGVDRDSTIPNASRVAVIKNEAKSHAPMRFKIDLPASYMNKSQYYMQLSDSDDEDKPDRPSKASKSAIGAGGKGGKKKGANAAVKQEIFFKHEHPIVRERPISAKLFRQVAANDPEFKVHYRHTNYRRMPLSEEQEHWLEEREIERTKKSEELAKQLAQAAQEKADKKKSKDGGKDGKKDKKDKKDDKGKRPQSASQLPEEKVKPKYKSATQFMSVHFPKFEDDDKLETMGPMRTMQLVEVSKIMEALENRRVLVKDSVLRKALVIPQDKPDAICLENLRDEKEGLMVNPNPPELWRKFSASKKGKKGGKKKKK